MSETPGVEPVVPVGEEAAANRPPPRAVDWEMIRRWTTSGAVLAGSASLIYSAWLLTGVARDVRYGPDFTEVTDGLDRVEASVTRAARVSAPAAPVRSGYESMFDKDEADIVNAIEAQTAAIRAEGTQTRAALAYR